MKNCYSFSLSIKFTFLNIFDVAAFPLENVDSMENSNFLWISMKSIRERDSFNGFSREIPKNKSSAFYMELPQ